MERAELLGSGRNDRQTVLQGKPDHRTGRHSVQPNHTPQSVLGEDPIAFDSTDIALRLRVSISFSFIVKDRMKDTVLLRDGVTGVAYFSAESGIGPTRAAEDEATTRALRDLAGQVVNRVMDGI